MAKDNQNINVAGEVAKRATAPNSASTATLSSLFTRSAAKKAQLSGALTDEEYKFYQAIFVGELFLGNIKGKLEAFQISVDNKTGYKNIQMTFNNNVNSKTQAQGISTDFYNQYGLESESKPGHTKAPQFDKDINKWFIIITPYQVRQIINAHPDYNLIENPTSGDAYMTPLPAQQ